MGRGFEARAAHPCPTQIWVPPPGQNHHIQDKHHHCIQAAFCDSFHNLTWCLCSRVDTDVDRKLRIVAIFLLFLTLWDVLTYKQADATLASLSILKYGALKWPHTVIRGSKNKSAWILFKSMSDRRPWLKNSKNVIIFQLRHVVLMLGVVKGQRLVSRLYWGSKIKLLQLSWKWWQIVHLLESIQKKNTLYYLKCQVTEIWCKKGLLPWLNGDLWHFDIRTYEGGIGGCANYSFSEYL